MRDSSSAKVVGHDTTVDPESSEMSCRLDCQYFGSLEITAEACAIPILQEVSMKDFALLEETVVSFLSMRHNKNSCEFGGKRMPGAGMAA